MMFNQYFQFLKTKLTEYLPVVDTFHEDIGLKFLIFHKMHFNKRQIMLLHSISTVQIQM